MGDQERFANELEGALHIKEQEKIIEQVCRVFACVARFSFVCARVVAFLWFQMIKFYCSET